MPLISEPGYLPRFPNGVHRPDRASPEPTPLALTTAPHTLLGVACATRGQRNRTHLL
jgi:hypothetical protein